MKQVKPVELDGRTGEGGGQVVRIAAALSSVTSQPFRIVHVRGNRAGPRGGGLKSQHVTSLAWLAKVTQADHDGLSVGSSTIDFRPRLRPCDLKDRKISISADSGAASTLLIFQAIFPFLLFAGNDEGEPIEVDISGGTNVSFSLSYEYLDQVLMPVLEDQFGIRVERRLLKRGFSQGPQTRGHVWFKIHPLRPGQMLKLRDPAPKAVPTSKDFEIKTVDISIITPSDMHTHLTAQLADRLGALFPDAELSFVALEESGHDSRMYVLCVAKSSGGLRWGRDVLWDGPRKKMSRTALGEAIARRVTRDLAREVDLRGTVDEFLQDQLVVFQALADGRTSFVRNEDGESLEEDVEGLHLGDGPSERLRRDKGLDPFGEGSTHTTTARWVTTEMLPHVKWFNKGRICEGIGLSLSSRDEEAT
ncbi:uncharacterized protein E0L32_008820 [Thyridium curvatum]|uniref:RNA 3'-terminal phosphate cyclase domain-containing protein n=1 Tax=Thyridium curvatum TaxID=1093900 RepID=A0A507AQB4_9PEZI|nr:uncharacterized protein E0L32_008820 [Thyridium curvatum]TPX09973.1 hypothetical protein E0L32_008820 [Thyridium curvatum]